MEKSKAGKAVLRRGAVVALAATLTLAGGALTGCNSQGSSQDDESALSSYPESVQLLYAEYESGDLADVELIDGYEALCTNGEITEAQLDELVKMVEGE